MRSIEELRSFLNEKIRLCNDKKYSVSFIQFAHNSICSGIYGDDYKFTNKTKGYIHIYYLPDEYLSVYLSKEIHDTEIVMYPMPEEEMIGEIIKQISEFVDYQSPICKYTYKTSEFTEEEKSKRVVEWDFRNPDERITTLVERQVNNYNSSVNDLTLFGSRNIDDYITNKSLENKDDKVYGIYPGIFCGTDYIDSYNEVDLYLFIKDTIKLRENVLNGKSNLKLSDIEYTLDYAKYLTKKFGVDVEPSKNERIKSESFDEWFKYYENYINNVMSVRERQQLILKHNKWEDTSGIIPTWKKSLKKYSINLDNKRNSSAI